MRRGEAIPKETMEDQITAAELAQELKADKPDHLSSISFANVLSRLLIKARIHGDLAVDACNGVQEDGLEHHEAQVQLTEARVTELCEELGWKANLGGDPRGYTVKVILPSGRYNTWGGAEEGWGI